MSSPYADQLKLGPSLWQYVCWIFLCGLTAMCRFLAWSTILGLFSPGDTTEGTDGGTGTLASD